MSQILNLSPFSDEMAAMTVQQMNWVVEMYAEDNPDTFKIEKKRDGLSPSQVMAAWANILPGGTLSDKLRAATRGSEF